jgi:undecaprenyl-diphosphatase
MLERLDQQLFLLLNSYNSPLFDKIMHVLSGKLIWVPLYLAIIIYLIVRYKRKFWIILIFIVMAVALTDQSSVLIKNIVQRWRPCHEPIFLGMVHTVGDECGGSYGFVSSHAANSFNVALISLLLIRKRWYSISIIVWAIIVGYSRIYLGVHYPGDVLCGSILGALIGWAMYRLYILTDIRLLSKRQYFVSD